MSTAAQTEIDVEAVETETLLPISILVKGEVVSSNFPVFAELVRARLSAINQELKTDEDFGQADKDARLIAGAESALKDAKENALKEAEQMHALFSQMDDLTGELAAARLKLAAQIKKRKEEVKAELVEAALKGFDIDQTLARKIFLPALENALKGKRNLESMKTALRVTATTAQALIKQSRALIGSFAATHGQEMVSDARELELQKPDAVEAELRRRFEAKRANEEAARLKSEIDKANAEAAEAKHALAESTKPPAPPVKAPVAMNPPAPAEDDAPWEPGNAPSREHSLADAPVVTIQLNSTEEWASFKQTFLAAMATVKEARAGLVHSANIAKAQGLASGINATYKEWV